MAERVYSQRERIEAANRIARRMPSLWNSAKRGVFVGLIAAGIGLGYKENVINAYLSSQTAQREVAEVLTKERDTRSSWQKLVGSGQKPAKVTVGPQFRDIRGPDGHLRSIGMERVYAGTPDYMRYKPTIPITRQAIPVGAVGAGAGAALGVAFWASRKRKLERLQTGILNGSISPSAMARARDRARLMRERTAAFGGRVKAKFKSLRRTR